MDSVCIHLAQMNTAQLSKKSSQQHLKIDHMHDFGAPESERKARIIHDKVLTTLQILADRKELIMKKYELVSQEGEWG